MLALKQAIVMEKMLVHRRMTREIMRCLLVHGLVENGGKAANIDAEHVGMCTLSQNGKSIISFHEMKATIHNSH